MRVAIQLETWYCRVLVHTLSDLQDVKCQYRLQMDLALTGSLTGEWVNLNLEPLAPMA